MQSQAGRIAIDLSFRRTEYAKGLRLGNQPVSSQLGALITLRRPSQSDDHVGLFGSYAVFDGVVKGVPIPVPANQWMIMKKEQQLRCVVLLACRIAHMRTNLVDEVAAQPTMDVGVRIGIAPAQVGFQDIASQIMRANAVMIILNEAEITQPVPELGDMLAS